MDHPNDQQRRAELALLFFEPLVTSHQLCPCQSKGKKALRISTVGCSHRWSSEAAASERPRRTLRYVEALNDGRTELAACFQHPAKGHRSVSLQWPTPRPESAGECPALPRHVCIPPLSRRGARVVTYRPLQPSNHGSAFPAH